MLTLIDQINMKNCITNNTLKLLLKKIYLYLPIAFCILIILPMSLWIFRLTAAGFPRQSSGEKGIKDIPSSLLQGAMCWLQESLSPHFYTCSYI